MATLLDARKALPPVVALTRFADTHPRAAAWLALSAGVCGILVVSGRNAALPLRPWLALFAAGITTAGLCVWIVGGGEYDGSQDE